MKVIDEASFVPIDQWPEMGDPFERYDRQDDYLNGTLVHSRWYSDDGRMVAEMTCNNGSTTKTNDFVK